MPFTVKEQRAVRRCRYILDGLPMRDRVRLDPTDPSGDRPDSFVPTDHADYLDSLLALEQRTIEEMDPADYTRPDVVNRDDFSQLALAYIAASAQARRPMQVREYWAVLWMAAADGVVVLDETTVNATQEIFNAYTGGNNPAPPAGVPWLSAAAYRNATVGELAQAGAVREDLTRYKALLRQIVTDGNLNAGNGSMPQAVQLVGMDMLGWGFTGKPSEMTVAWMREQGLYTANVFALIDRTVEYWGALLGSRYGVGTRADLWTVAAAFNDGEPVWSAAMAAFTVSSMLQHSTGYEAPDLGTPHVPPYVPTGLGPGIAMPDEAPKITSGGSVAVLDEEPVSVPPWAAEPDSETDLAWTALLALIAVGFVFVSQQPDTQ